RLALRLWSCHLHKEVLVRRKKLMQRRIDEPDDHGKAMHRSEDAAEIVALEWQQQCQLAAPLLAVGGEDHALHDGQAVLLHEHVLGATQPDTLCAEPTRTLRVMRVVAVGPHFQAPKRVGPAEKLLELPRDFRLEHGDSARNDPAGAAVDGERVALLDDGAASAEVASVQ